MVAVTIAMSLNNAFSKNLLWISTLMISPCNCGLYHILARLAEADCKHRKIMRNGLKIKRQIKVLKITKGKVHTFTTQ